MSKYTTLFLCVIAFAAFTACKQEKPKASANSIHIAASADSAVASKSAKEEEAIITFEKTEHDFGIVMQGERAEFNFKFKNTGDADLLIANAVGSCGCTVPEFSKEPIKPGSEGFIKVKFNSEYREDKFTKEVYVTTNTTPPQTTLIIKGFVQVKNGSQLLK
jgi:hypothetical protein